MSDDKKQQNIYEQTHREMFSYFPDPILLFDKQGKLLYYNHPAEMLFGNGCFKRTSSPMLFDLLPKLQEHVSFANINSPQVIEIMFENEHGDRLLEIRGFPFIQMGQTQGFVTLIKDVTDLSKLKLELIQYEKLYESWFLLNPNVVFLLTKDGDVSNANRAAVEMLGVSLNQLIGQPFHMIVLEQYQGVVKTKLTKALQGNVETFDVAVKAEESESTLSISFIPSFHDANLESLIVIGKDNTKKVIAQKRAERMANEDALTGLPNRKLLISTIEQLVLQQENEQAAVLFIDIDRFKMINDTLGHSLGDRALIEISKRLESCKRKQDVLARMAGDEFILLLYGITSKEDVDRVCEVILARMREPLEVDGYEFTLTSSIGVSMYPENGKDAQTLIKCADIAMYRAKEQGADSYEWFSSEMNLKIYESFRVENGLRKALERGEFELYYQPQFKAVNKEVAGVEVLVRWQHPVYGIIPPGKFISIAEETGLIDEIGELVLFQACKQMKKWIDNGFAKIPISVNISLRQFMQKNIVHMVEDILLKTGLPPHLLDLEITESVTVDLTRTIKVLHQLKNLGVRLSLDDFGTGYSSLQYLSELPIDELKIDQSFVRNIGQSKQKNAIISMIIHLGHVLHLEVIAEGVESQEQLDFLIKERCDKVQGYYYSKPLNVKQYEEASRTFLLFNEGG